MFDHIRRAGGQVTRVPACAALLVLSSLVGASTTNAQSAAPTFDRGPYGVGFQVIALRDPSRPTGPKSTAGDRARPVSLHVWYPAVARPGSVLSMADYLRENGPDFAPQHRRLLARLPGGPLSEEDWTRYQRVAFTARRDAPAAPGRFPLLIGILRPISVVTMSEYLASHGYVVAFVAAPTDAIAAQGLTLEGLVMAERVRDMQLAVAALRERPFVNATSLGALGFSGSGLAQLVLAMRSGDVDAVSQLETGYFGPDGTSSYQEVKAYDPEVLRAPFLYAYGESLGKNTPLQIAELEKMSNAPRFLLRLGQPRMHHWDFATEGLVMATAMDKRADDRAGVVRTFAAVMRYQRTFFDAFVKGDAAARASVGTAPPISEGPPIEVRVIAAGPRVLGPKTEPRTVVENYLKAVAAMDAEAMNSFLADSYTLTDLDGTSRAYVREKARDICGWEKGMNTRWDFEILRADGTEVTVLSREHSDFFTYLDLGFGVQMETLTVKDGKIVANHALEHFTFTSSQDEAYPEFKRWLASQPGIKEPTLIRPDGGLTFDAQSAPAMSRWMRKFSEERTRRPIS